MKKDEFAAAITRAQLEINDQLNSFKEQLAHSTEDSNNFLSMSELERQWRNLRLSTNKTYSDLVSQALSSMDTKEVNAAKKANSSRKESD